MFVMLNFVRVLGALDGANESRPLVVFIEASPPYFGAQHRVIVSNDQIEFLDRPILVAFAVSHFVSTDAGPLLDLDIAKLAFLALNRAFRQTIVQTQMVALFPPNGISRTRRQTRRLRWLSHRPLQAADRRRVASL